MFRMRIRVTATLVATATALTGLSALESARASVNRRPACTRAALTAALHRDGMRTVRRGRIPAGARSFACAGRYATSGEIVGSGRSAVEITVLYRRRDDRWYVVSRATPCARHWVPRAIYRAACESN